MRRKAMPKVIEYRSIPVQTVADLHAVAHQTDFVQLEELTRPNGETSSTRAVVNTVTGDEVGSVGPKYHLVQHETVLQLVADAMQSAGLEFAQNKHWRNRVVMGPSKLWGKFLLDGKYYINGDESPYHLGMVVRNSVDGSSSIEASFFFLRSFCTNGMMFGKVDLNKGRHRHTTKSVEQLTSGLATFMQHFTANARHALQSLGNGFNVTYETEEEMHKALEEMGFGKRIVPKIQAAIPEYQKTFGMNAFTLYQAATHVVSREVQFNDMAPTAEERNLQIAAKLIA